MKKYFPALQHSNIPNAVTSLGLIFGVAACYFLSIGSIRGTIVCVSVSMLMDLIDGILADKLNQRTRFGAYLDSFVDFFVCCIVPTLMAYTFVGASIPLFAAMAFFCICGMWRLAYYQLTTIDAVEKRNYFTGLPVPGGALFVSIAIWAAVNYGIPAWVCTLAFFLTGLLMLSFFKLEKYGLWQKAMWALGLGFFGLVVSS